MGGDVAQLVERQTSMALRQVWFPGVKRDFSPRVNFQYRLSYGVHTSPCAIACVNICVHIKDPVVHVRVLWITETVKHPACTVGWVALLCCSWLTLGKATPISDGRNPNETIQLFIIIIYPLTVRVTGAPQTISQPVSSIFPCSPLPSGTWWTPGLPIAWCSLPTSSFVCLVFFPLSLCLARWFWHGHFTAGSWHGLPRW